MIFMGKSTSALNNKFQFFPIIARGLNYFSQQPQNEMLQIFICLNDTMSNHLKSIFLQSDCLLPIKSTCLLSTFDRHSLLQLFTNSKLLAKYPNYNSLKVSENCRFTTRDTILLCKFFVPLGIVIRVVRGNLPINVLIN